MAVLKFDEYREDNRAEILFGVILPDIVYELMDVALSDAAFENAIKTSLNINPKRLIKIVEAVQGGKKEVLILVIYDKLVSDNLVLREKLNLKDKEIDFNFKIYYLDFNKDINIEYQIAYDKGENL